MKWLSQQDAQIRREHATMPSPQYAPIEFIGGPWDGRIVTMLLPLDCDFRVPLNPADWPHVETAHLSYVIYERTYLWKACQPHVETPYLVWPAYLMQGTTGREIQEAVRRWEYRSIRISVTGTK